METPRGSPISILLCVYNILHLILSFFVDLSITFTAIVRHSDKSAISQKEKTGATAMTPAYIKMLPVTNLLSPVLSGHINSTQHIPHLVRHLFFHHYHWEH